MLVKHELTCGRTAGGYAQTVNHIVKATLEKLEKNLTCNTLCAGCFLEEVAELTFKNAICIFCFLLLAELKTILGGLATAIGAMLSRRIVLLCQNFVIAEDRFTELTGEFGFWSCVSCPFVYSLIKAALERIP